jgi:hypothetical protein
MSLRKSPQLTPQLLAAARNNAQHSTGPRSAAAKQNSKLNTLDLVGGRWGRAGFSIQGSGFRRQMSRGPVTEDRERV